MQNASLCVRNEVGLDFFSQRYVGHHYFMVEQRYPRVAIDPPRLPQAEDVFGGGVGFWQGKRSEEAIAFFPGFLKADTRDLPCSRMNIDLHATLRWRSKGMKMWWRWLAK
jgi:hypothetical protein